MGFQTCKVNGCVDWRGIRGCQRTRRAKVGWLNGLGTSRFDDPTLLPMFWCVREKPLGKGSKSPLAPGLGQRLSQSWRSASFSVFLEKNEKLHMGCVGSETVGGFCMAWFREVHDQAQLGD